MPTWTLTSSGRAARVKSSAKSSSDSATGSESQSAADAARHHESTSTGGSTTCSVASFGALTALPLAGAPVLLDFMFSTSALANEATHFADGELPPWFLYAFLFLPSLVYASFFILREKVIASSY